MACTPLPDPPALPELPDGISLDPPLPSGPTVPELCCKILALPPVPPLAPLPPGAMSPVLAALIETIQAGVAAYKDALPLNCPRE
jgi:hypothetical protein